MLVRFLNQNKVLSTKQLCYYFIALWYLYRVNRIAINF